MLRLLLLPFLLIIFSSCNDASKEVDPLFYQISEADSTWCMDEIVSEILDDTLEIYVISGCVQDFTNPYNGPLHLSQISFYSRAGMAIDHKMDTAKVAEFTYEYFMHNRTLTQAQSEDYLVNQKYHGFECPFYNQFSLKEIQQKIKETQRQFDEIKKVPGLDSSLLEYEASKVEHWKVMKKAIELLKNPTLPQISLQAHVQFGLPESALKGKEAMKQIAFAFYQMRNFECLKYFNETYLSLYERAQRKKRKIDLDKLDVLKLIHPSAIVIDRHQETRLSPTKPPKQL